MVTCAFAVTGRSEIANAALINRSFILLVPLDAAQFAYEADNASLPPGQFGDAGVTHSPQRTANPCLCASGTSVAGSVGEARSQPARPSARAQINYAGWTVFAAGSITGDDSKMFSPFGTKPNYTDMQQVSFVNANISFSACRRD